MSATNLETSNISKKISADIQTAKVIDSEEAERDKIYNILKESLSMNSKAESMETKLKKASELILLKVLANKPDRPIDDR